MDVVAKTSKPVSMIEAEIATTNHSTGCGLNLA
jgi:hypothetical protein